MRAAWIALAVLAIAACGGEASDGGGGADSAVDAHETIDVVIDSSIAPETSDVADADADADAGIDADADADADAAPDVSYEVPDGCAPVDYDAGIQPLWDKYCATTGCHSGTSPTGGKVFTYASTVGVPCGPSDAGTAYIDPYEPCKSCIVLKENWDPAECPSPPGHVAFAAAPTPGEVARILCWIEEGAPP